MSKCRKLFGVIALLLGLSPSGVAADFVFSSRATFLRDDTGATDAYVLNLGGLGFNPGDFVRLQAFGDFDPYGGNNPQEALGALGLFSSTAVLLGSDQTARVPGAIAAEFNHTTGASFYGTNREIAEDFLISPTGVTLQIPAGANYLFLAANDNHYGLNEDYDANWGVRLVAIPEPATAAGIVGALIFLATLNRRRSARAD